MKRGEIWTVATGSGFGSKPRPCVLVQDDSYGAIGSVTVAMCTSVQTEAEPRVWLEPTPANGLERPTRIMVDKLITVPRSKLGVRLGHLTPAETTELNRALIVFLGLSDT